MRSVGTVTRAALLGVGLLQPCVLAQETVTFDPSSRQQVLQRLEMGSEVHMYHPVHNPDPRGLVVDLRTHNYTMCLKPDIEQTNDNADPYVANAAGFNPRQGGKSGREMSAYFPFLRECKRLTDSVRTANPSLKPFSIQFKGGFYDRYIPTWIETTIGSTSQVDSNQYPEYAENIYYQCKIYRDSTGVDVDYIDPVPAYPVLTSSSLSRLLDTLGTYLAGKGLSPALGFGHGLDLTNTTNQNLMLSHIRTVFASAIGKQCVKRVTLAYRINPDGGQVPGAFLRAVVDSSRKYSFDVAIEYTDGYYNNNLPWPWTLNTSNALDSALNTGRAASLYFDAMLNSEVGFAAMLWYDYQANTPGYTLDDPNTKFYRTPAYYYARHLFGHTNAAASRVLPTTSTNASIQRVVVYDTAANKISLMLTNRSAADISVRLNSGAFSPSTYDAYRLSAGEVNLRLPSVTSGSTILLPASSTTFLTNDYIPSDPTPPVAPVLAQKLVTPYSCDLTWTVADNTDALMFDVYDGATLIRSSLPRWAYSAVALAPQTQHSFTVKARDSDGNYSVASNAIVVTTPAVTRVVKEIWDDIPGGNMLTSQIPIATPPQRYLETDSINSIHTESLSGERIRGYIVPPATGTYRFYFTSCAYGDFYLSPDTASANKTRRAYFGTWNTCPNTNGWHDFAGQISDTIGLVADRYYYFEILHKVWWQGALLQLAWTGPGMTDTTILRTPYIRPYALNGGMVGVARRPTSGTPGTLSLSLVSSIGPSGSPLVRFCLPSSQEHVVLTLSDLRGRAVRTLVKGPVSSGVHAVAVGSSGTALCPGTYILRLRAGATDKCVSVMMARQ